MEYFVIEKGLELFRQDDVANYFFILKVGSLEVLIDNQRKNII